MLPVRSTLCICRSLLNFVGLAMRYFSGLGCLLADEFGLGAEFSRFRSIAVIISSNHIG